MWIEETVHGTYKFVEEYKDLSGKRRRVSVTYEKNTATTRKLAQKELNEKIKVRSQTVDNIDFNTLLDLYIENKKKTLKRTSCRVICTQVNNLRKYYDCSKKLSDISPVELNFAFDSAPVSLQRQLRHVLNFAYKKCFTGSKIADRLNFTQKTEPISAGKLYYEKEELEEVFKKLEKSDCYTARSLRLICEFLTLTGLRIGECLALEISDFNEEESTISITKSATDNLVHTPKSKHSIRTLSINQRARQIIKEAEFLKRVLGIQSEIIFSNTNGTHFYATNLRTVLKRYEVDTHFHLFRHTHASLLSEEGIGLDTIQRRLGHANDEITREIYVHITKNVEKKEKALFSELKIL